MRRLVIDENGLTVLDRLLFNDLRIRLMLLLCVGAYVALC